MCAMPGKKSISSPIPFVMRPGLPLPYDSEPIVPGPRRNRQKQFSAQALAHPPDYDRARAVALFNDVLRTLIHGLKYSDRREGLELFGRWLVVAGRELLEDTDLIVPVPLYRGRLWQRRFNQSALLSHEINRLTGVPVDVLALKRHRATRSQVGLSTRALPCQCHGCLYAVTKYSARRSMAKTSC